MQLSAPVPDANGPSHEPLRVAKPHRPATFDNTPNVPPVPPEAPGGPPADPGWSTLHDLTLLFLSLTHGTDADLSPEEVSSTQKRLKRWFPDASDDALSRAGDEVMLVYLGEGREGMVQMSAESIRQNVTADQRVALLNDLADLAHADGAIAPGEVEFIRQLAAYWGAGA